MILAGVLVQGLMQCMRLQTLHLLQDLTLKCAATAELVSKPAAVNNKSGREDEPGFCAALQNVGGANQSL